MTEQLDRTAPDTRPAQSAALPEEWLEPTPDRGPVKRSRVGSFLGGSLDSRGRRPDRSSVLIVSPAVAVLYGGLALLTLGLAQMTGLASPVWPAAGVALAAALRWGWRALPGIFLGSFGANVLWLLRMGDPDPKRLLATAVIGVGAVLGAAAGAALVYRYVGTVRRLDTPRAVILTLGLGGLVATTIAPTVGVAAQLATGLLSTGLAPYGWLTWWVGDSIGVIVFTPLVLMSLPSQAGYWVGRRWRIAVPSLLIFAVIVGAVIQNITYERARIDAAVQQLGQKAGTDLGRNIALHQEVLEGLGSLVDANPELTGTEFDAYTAALLDRFPNLQALSWNPVVAKADLDAFVARQRAQPGLEKFSVTQRDASGNLQPVSPRPEYVVVAYIQPIESNRNALGFDIYSNPARAVAIDTAWNTGRPTGTSPIDLVQESGKQKGMLALLPIYKGGDVPETESARRADLRGFAVGVYRLGDLLAETFRGADWDAIDVSLVDVSDLAAPVVIADLPARKPGSPERDGAAPAATTSPLDVYGRTWELTVRPTSADFVDSRPGLIVLLMLATLAVTFLLEAFLLVLSGMESLARRLISELGSAARYVTSILPRDIDGPVPVASRFIPSDELGGDSFDHRWVDEDHLIAYLVDVCGHGITPAMFSISVHNLLRSGTLDQDTLLDPGRVLAELNRLFQMDKQAGNYFTIWYGVYQPSTRTLRYSGAGHPPAILVSQDGSDPVRLPSTAVPIGVLPDTVFETHSYSVRPDTALLIYSDGAYELALPNGERWAIEDFIDLCAQSAHPPHWSLDSLVEQLRDRTETGRFDDDCTLVRVTFP